MPPSLVLWSFFETEIPDLSKKRIFRGLGILGALLYLAKFWTKTAIFQNCQNCKFLEIHWIHFWKNAPQPFILEIFRNRNSIFVQTTYFFRFGDFWGIPVLSKILDKNGNFWKLPKLPIFGNSLNQLLKKGPPALYFGTFSKHKFQIYPKNVFFAVWGFFGPFCI